MLLIEFVMLVIVPTTAWGSSSTVKETEQCCESYCYEEDKVRPQYHRLGSKSAYPFAKGTDHQIYNVPGCSAEKIWMLVRHGTRLPKPTLIPQLNDLENLRDEILVQYDSIANNSNLPEDGRLCEADLNLLRNWRWDPNITAEYGEHLTLSGWNEVKDLAKDYKNAFPDVIGNVYSAERFRFGYTDYQRTEASYQAFVEGLFGDGAYNNFTIDRPPNPNIVTSPFSFCDAYNENLAVQNGPNSEIAKFQKSEIFQRLCSDVATKLGFIEPLTAKTVLNIYEICRFEKAWYIDRSSAWYSVLTQSQFEVIEYDDDLARYMESGYGFDINSNLFCSGMDEMLTHMATDASPKVVVYFGHVYFQHAFLTALGAVKDTVQLRSNNYEVMADRQWKNSAICPFTANIAAVKYNCPNDVDENVKVKFFLNQKTLTLDSCDSSGVCKLSDLLERYSVFRNGDCEKVFCPTDADSSGNDFNRNFGLIFFVDLILLFYIKKM